jgi:hypothetical protein
MVILYGKTVLMDGLALIFQNNSDFQVVTAIDLAETEQILGIAEQAAIIVDSAAGQDWFETLYRRYPAALVIAVNPENISAMVYSQDQVRGVDDLKDIIKKHSQHRNNQGRR